MQSLTTTSPARKGAPGQKCSLTHMAADKWEFDEGVTAVFDDMLARSIPQLGAMRDLVTTIAKRFIQPKTDVVDLGCSRGDAMALLIPGCTTSNRFVGVEVSHPMRRATEARFADLIKQGVVQVRSDDLKLKYPDVRASVTLCVLTLMFIPIEHRFRFLANAFRRTVPGGAFILVEKLLGGDALMDETFLGLYLDYKKAMGYSQEAIDRKRLALEGVLVPVSAAFNEQLLKGAGFTHIECFWRYLNFGAWLAIKPPAPDFSSPSIRRSSNEGRQEPMEQGLLCPPER
jgi:tRNA (cmo5U34)-methyltransferase